MAHSEPVTYVLTAGYNPHWRNGSSKSLRMKPTIFMHQVVFNECTHPKARKSDWGNSPFTSMNLLLKVATFLGVSPIGNFCFIEPGSSSRISLLWPTGKAARLEILPIVIPDCALTSPSTCYRRRDTDCRYDNGNIRSMLGRKKRRILI